MGMVFPCPTWRFEREITLFFFSVLLLLAILALTASLHRSISWIRRTILVSPFWTSTQKQAESEPLLTLLFCIVLAYIGLLLFYVAFVTQSARFGLYDRYLLPVVFLMGTAILRFAYAGQNGKLPMSAWSLLAISLFTSAISVQGTASFARAYEKAIHQTVQMGYHPPEVGSTFFRDMDSQIRFGGGALACKTTLDKAEPLPRPVPWPIESLSLSKELLPAVVPKIMINPEGSNELLPTEVATIPYTFWVPPFKQGLYLQKVPPHRLDAMKHK